MRTDVTAPTIGQYIQGKLRNIKVTEDALASALMDAQASHISMSPYSDEETPIEEIIVNAGTRIDILTEKQRDLTLAGIYIWAATSPSTSSKVSDEDGDWSHSEGGEKLSQADINHFLRLAKALYDKWGISFPIASTWGFKGTGFRYKRK